MSDIRPSVESRLLEVKCFTTGPSVCPSVRLFVRLSVRLFVRPSPAEDCTFFDDD